MKDHEIFDSGAERSVLSAMMGSADVAAEMGSTLKADDFFGGRHKTMFKAIKELSDSGLPTDPIAVIDKLGAAGDLASAGGDSYVVELAGDCLSYASYQHHSEIIKKHSLRRHLIAASERIRNLAFTGDLPVEGMVDEAEAILTQATIKTVPNGFDSLANVANRVYGEICNRSNDMGDDRSLHFGVNSLDKLFPDGIRPGQLLVVGARPAVGKTAFAVFCGVEFARQSKRVAFYSEEMTNDEIAYRLYALESCVSSSALVSGACADVQKQLIADARERLIEMPIVLNDEPGMTIPRMRAQCRRKMLRGGAPEVIIVDYLQLLQSTEKYTNRYQEVSGLSRSLKLMARELKVPVVALAQLSRQSEQRPDRRPQLSDLRDSGSIEQDADTVLLLDASATEEEASRPERPDWGKRRIIVAKHRNGPIGDVDLNFSPATCAFAE